MISPFRFLFLLGQEAPFRYVTLLLEELLLRPATLPAILPVTDKELKAERVNLHARLETDAEVSVVHLVLVDV